jgi:hypothetical protein
MTLMVNVLIRHAEMEVHEKREKTMRKIKKHMNMMMIALIGKRNLPGSLLKKAA